MVGHATYTLNHRHMNAIYVIIASHGESVFSKKKKTGKFDQLVRSRNHRQQEGNWITQIRVYTTLNIDWFFIDDRNDNWIAVFMKKVWSQHSQRLATETSNNSFLFLFFFFWLLICLEKNFSSGRFVITAPNTNLCNVFNQMLSVGLFLF